MTAPTDGSPLRTPIFRAIWSANMCSNLGLMVQAVGASWMMTELGGSPQMIALVQTAASLPTMLLALVAGAVADSYNRRNVMLAANGFMMATALVMALCAWSKILSPSSLLAFTFLLGCGSALHNPAWQALVGEILPRSALSSASALNSIGFNVARSLGPAIGGLIVSLGGALAAFFVNAMSYTGLLAVLVRWRPKASPDSLPREKFVPAMGAGVRYVTLSPMLMRLMCRALLFGLAASVLPATMPLIARDLVKGGAMTYGILLASYGAGGMIGALGSAYLRRLMAAEAVAAFSAICLAMAAALVSLASYLPIILMAHMMAGAGYVVAFSTYNVSVQLSAPRWVAARALALYQMAAFAGIALGSFLFGTIASEMNIVTALRAAAVLQIASVVAGMRWPIVVNENQDLSAAEWAPPQDSPVGEAIHGPITVQIDYEVRHEDRDAFLTIMNERGRIRRRDGARRWMLLRSLSAPGHWTEKYEVANWEEYLRHNRRRTNEDRSNFQSIRMLTVGVSPPIVKYFEVQTFG